MGCLLATVTIAPRFHALVAADAFSDVVIYVQGHLDRPAVEALVALIDDHAHAERALLVDFSEVDGIDVDAAAALATTASAPGVQVRHPWGPAVTATRRPTDGLAPAGQISTPQDPMPTIIGREAHQVAS